MIKYSEKIQQKINFIAINIHKMFYVFEILLRYLKLFFAKNLNFSIRMVWFLFYTEYSIKDILKFYYFFYQFLREMRSLKTFSLTLFIVICVFIKNSSFEKSGALLQSTAHHSTTHIGFRIIYLALKKRFQ